MMYQTDMDKQELIEHILRCYSDATKLLEYMQFYDTEIKNVNINLNDRLWMIPDVGYEGYVMYVHSKMTKFGTIFAWF